MWGYVQVRLLPGSSLSVGRFESVFLEEKRGKGRGEGNRLLIEQRPTYFIWTCINMRRDTWALVWFDLSR